MTIAVIIVEGGVLILDLTQMTGYFILDIYQIKYLIMPALNYERHGIVSHRPAEVKFELD